jgi:death on curing protein
VDEVTFLTFDEVLALHTDQLSRYGGRDGILDPNVVKSAIAQARVTMFGQYLHSDIAEMAAAYLCHFAAAQGFVDGNKRTGAVCALVFLERNGYTVDCTEDEFYDVTMGVANHLIDKLSLGNWIRERLLPIA